MDFLNPDALWWLLAVPVAVGLFWRAARTRASALRAFFGVKPDGADLVMPGLPTPEATAARRARRQRWRAALLVAALALLVVALAGPRYGTQLREVQEESLDLVVALDVSASMLAEDVAPSRLDRAKYELRALLDEVQGARVGLIVFAGDAFIQAPLTSDFGAIRLFLDAANPDLVPTPGTDYGRMLRLARRAFDVTSEDGSATPRPRALLVVSDGEQHEGGLADGLAQMDAAGVEVYAAGIGETDGAPIPLYRRGRLVGYKTDRDGNTVQTQLEEAVLRDLAGDGDYFRIARASSELPQVADRLERAAVAVAADERFETYAERFQIPLALALLLLLAERGLAAESPARPMYAREQKATV
ncbi:MAG: VWA domain-containing protein [Bacteroidota bacterium]